MKEAISSGSMVRKMFEEGRRLKEKFGEEEVFDFSLGNPDLPPPISFIKRAKEILDNNVPGIHGYMPNSGWTDTKSAIAEYLNETQSIGLEKRFAVGNIIMTVGVAGAINVVLKTIIEPDDEIIVLAPFFMEYRYYADNHGGKIKIAESSADFRPDPEAIRAAINPKTRALIINSPNNPTGVIYNQDELRKIGDVLKIGSEKNGRPIILIADEPYRKITFMNFKVPPIFQFYPHSVVVNSFSKDLSIAGERIGYAAVCPDFPNGNELMEGMTIANRILGFVNAPSLMQKIVIGLLHENAELSAYESRIKFMANGLGKIGYKLVPPQGTFYLFPESPIKDDLAFIDILKEERILAVPGRGFSRPGYFRLSLSIAENLAQKSLPGFARALEKAKAY
jgi:aspartate aminotransferase